MESACKCDIDTTADCGEIDSLEKLKWWQKATIYQVLIQSFQDTTGDGKGDIRGVVNRLDYFVTLGVDVIWVAPVYESPMADMGLVGTSREQQLKHAISASGKQEELTAGGCNIYGNTIGTISVTTTGSTLCSARWRTWTSWSANATGVRCGSSWISH